MPGVFTALRSNRWVWAVLAVAGLSFAAFLFFGGEKAAVVYRTTPVDKADITSKVTASGILSALVTVQVGSQVSGRIQVINADFNTKVKKGQLIAKIDPLLFEAEIRRAAANRSAAVGNLEKARAQETEARRQFERMAPLAEKKLLAMSDLDTAEAGWIGAKAQIKSAQGALAQADAALYQARINQRYTNIYSPINGIVISRNVDIGQTVAASLQAPTLFVIAEDLAKMQVDTSVAEADIGKITTGMETVFTVDAYPGERFRGTVRQVRNAAQSVQNIITYNAVVDVGNPELKLKPGMTANVTFVLDQKQDALRLPTAAFRYSPATPETDAPREKPVRKKGRGGEGKEKARTVWVLREGSAVPVTVQTGVSDGVHAEILGGGLQEGDAVITEEEAGGKPDEGGKRRRMF